MSIFIWGIIWVSIFFFIHNYDLILNPFVIKYEAIIEKNKQNNKQIIKDISKEKF